jgi:hypothetical protein
MILGIIILVFLQHFSILVYVIVHHCPLAQLNFILVQHDSVASLYLCFHSMFLSHLCICSVILGIIILVFLQHFSILIFVFVHHCPLAQLNFILVQHDSVASLYLCFYIMNLWHHYNCAYASWF